MADAIKQEFGLECELIKSGGGIFDVRANGDLIYSKHETGRFPEHAEVLNKIAPMVR